MMQRFALSAVALVLACEHRAVAEPSGAEFRRWEGSSNCTGPFTVLSTDKLNECIPYLIPAPASLRVEYVDETHYASYHYQGATDCSGNRTHLGDFVVGTCEDFGSYSQMRVWNTAPAPPPGQCAAPGHCGHAYQACCLAGHVSGKPCACKLRNGTGEAGSADCGFCGKAFVTCCTGYKLGGAPCACDVASGAAAVVVV